MVIQHLAYLAALAREGHFGRAAASCHVSQPTLSAGIRRLEAEFGVSLVQRAQRFEGLTPEGERVLVWAHQILADVDGMRQEVDAMRTGLTGRLRLGAIPTSLPSVSLLTTPFTERHPGVSVSIHSLTSRQIERGLDDYSLDVGLTYFDSEPLSGVRSLPLYRERYVLLTAADGPFADHAEVEWAEAARTPLCLLTEDMQNRRIVDELFHEAGAHPRPVIETNSISTLYAHTRDGTRSSVMAHAWLFLFGVPDGLRAVPLVAPEATRGIAVVTPERVPQGILAGALLEVAGELELQPVLDRVLVSAGDGRVTALDLRGLIVPVVTPFDAALGVDLDALERHAAAVLDAGARGIVALATTGEPTSLDEAERAAVVDACAGVCADRDSLLIVGAGTNDTRTTVARHQALAQVRGCAASLAVVPYYVRPSEAAIVAHFRHVAERSPVPLVVYNIPYRTGRGLGAEQLLELAATPNVAGLKQAVGAIDVDTLALLAEAPRSFAVLGGDDAFLYPLVLMGGQGAIAASANVATGRFAAMLACGLEGRLAEGRAHAEALLPLTRVLFAEPSPAVIKAVLHAQGQIPTPHVRMPLGDASPGARAAAVAIVDAL